MSESEIRKKIVESYINSYNNFDVENMLKDLDENVIFRNTANGAVNLTTEGIDEFRNQAEQAKTLFSQREQKITRLEVNKDTVEVEISYSGTLAVDLPDSLKAGSRIELAGNSIFRFAGDKIIEIDDIS